jgi:hypothetical protein
VVPGIKGEPMQAAGASAQLSAACMLRVQVGWQRAVCGRARGMHAQAWVRAQREGVRDESERITLQDDACE